MDDINEFFEPNLISQTRKRNFPSFRRMDPNLDTSGICPYISDPQLLIRDIFLTFHMLFNVDKIKRHNSTKLYQEKRYHSRMTDRIIPEPRLWLSDRDGTLIKLCHSSQFIYSMSLILLRWRKIGNVADFKDF